MNAACKNIGRPGIAPETVIQELTKLVDELQSLVQAENKALRRGLPASLSTSTQRKNGLADEFERWVALIAANPLAMGARPASLTRHLLERADALNTEMAENVELLQKAIHASRARIEAIMSAIRAHSVESATYGADARRSAPRACNSYGGGVRV